MKNHENAGKTEAGKRPWKRPELKYVGTVGEVLQTGGGKLSITGGDPGEGRKPQGQG